MKRRDLIAAAAGAIAATVLAGGVAWAAIPGPSGVIQGCYDSGGNVKVVEALTCPRNYTPFQWNAQGPPGTHGADGADGVSPSVSQLAAGDANCPAGGAAITDATGESAYVCSGENGEDGDPFSGTFASPNGEYAISVTDTGVTLSRGTGVSIKLAGNDVEIRGRNLDLNADIRATLKGAAVAEVQGGTSATLKGAIAEVEGGASATLRGNLATVQGNLVQIKGGGACLPAARLNDPVVAPGGAGVIVGGAPTVCVG
jgi:hypothetical protein